MTGDALAGRAGHARGGVLVVVVATFFFLGSVRVDIGYVGSVHRIYFSLPKEGVALTSLKRFRLGRANFFEGTEQTYSGYLMCSKGRSNSTVPRVRN